MDPHPPAPRCCTHPQPGMSTPGLLGLHLEEQAGGAPASEPPPRGLPCSGETVQKPGGWQAGRNAACASVSCPQ